MNLDQKVNQIKAFNSRNNFGDTDNFIEFDWVAGDILETRQLVADTVRFSYYDLYNDEEIAMLKHDYFGYVEVVYYEHEEHNPISEKRLQERIDIRINEAELINASIKQKRAS